ncbi:HD domain-containing protein [Paenibacillus agilis]|uniref:HD domain-containing protein n=1 Tax=Paenibacillus agilis TaxID=3020863 RepID=A0A559IWS1_9BACL|nr:HD domain-containing protein [Paenibacillus agilis]TVX92078.1 HD domain-containing protein [Paenibacillus agilis]
MESILQKQLQFLIEIDKLKTIQRKTKIVSDTRLENDAEHSWHIAVMALILNGHANEEVDLFKVVKMLLIHDLVEIDAGDTFAYDTSGYEDKHERELQAAQRIFGLLPAEQGEELMNLWLEFERKESKEAQFAASLDRLHPILNNYQNEGDTWLTYQITSEQILKRNREIDNGSKTLWAYTQQLVHDSIARGYVLE